MRDGIGVLWRWVTSFGARLLPLACVTFVLVAIPSTASASSLDPASELSSLSLSLSSPAAGVTGVTYTVQFTTSSTGALASGSGQITLTAPAGTVFPVENVQGIEGAFINDVYDVTAGQDLGYSRGGALSDGGSTAAWTVEPNIPAGHEIRLTIDGVTNPAVGTYQLGISTSSDTAEAETPSYSTTPSQAITSPAVSLSSSTAAGATGVTYTVQFTTSSTGDLAPGGGQITLTAPAGTVFPVENLEGVEGAVINDVYDVTSGQDLGYSRGGVLSDGGSTATWTVEPNIPAGHEIRLTIDGVTNPAAGTYQFGISTSSDTAEVETPSYSTTPPQAIGSPSVSISQPAVASETGVTYEVQFTTSSTGELVSGNGQITLTAPAGTVFPVENLEGVEGAVINDVYDVTAGKDLGYSRGGTLSDGGSTATWTVEPNIPAGHVIDLTIDGVTNPDAGSYQLGISTSSDSGSQTASYTVVQDTVPQLSGTVTYQSGNGPAPVAGSLVQACAAATCVSALAPTDGNGDYSLYVPSPGDYTVTAFPPNSNDYSVGEGSAGPVTVTSGANTADVTLPALSPLPSGVTFNGQSGTVPSVYWDSPSALSVQGCKGGAGDVTVSSVNSQTGALDQTFIGLTEDPPGSGTYTATIPALYPSHGPASIDPEISCSAATALLPSSGSADGGTAVQITGTGFTGATGVMFGSTPAESFTVASDSEIDAVAPPGAGTVAVSVITPGGTIASATLAQYTYLSVTAVTPSSGPAAGGTSVTLTGSGLSGVEAVYFGDNPATDVTVNSDSQITATAPAGTGTAAVTVLTTDGGESAAGSATFAYGTDAANSAAGKAHAAVIRPSTTPVAAHSSSQPATNDTAGGLTPVSPATQLSYVTGQMLQYQINGCTGSACAAFADDATQGLSQIAQNLTNGTPLNPSGPSENLELCNGQPCLNLPEPPPAPTSAPQYEWPPGSAAFGVDHWSLCLRQQGLIVTRSFYCSANGLYYYCDNDGEPGSLPGNNCGYVARIDPSGTIEDTNGNPVSGATVTLLQSDNPLGPFTAPPSGSPIMAPSVNPETSDASGAFDWDVFAGYYQVTASSPGCAAPGNASQPTVSTPVFQVPPPQDGLVLTLNCAGESPPPTPAVTGLSDSTGPAAGGTQVDVQGSGFTSSAGVSFGGVKASAITVLSPTEIVATAPAGSGTVDVQVTTADGTSTTSAADVFAYVGAASVTQIDPTQGPPTGGTTVEITGSGFAAGDQVAFGPAVAGSVTVVSSTEILAVAPPGTGPVDVTVTNADGASATSPADQYTFLGASPAITSASAATFTAGTAGSFTVTTTGQPTPAITESGALPAGVTLTDNGDGTATLAGTPAAGTSGSYPITITASNGISPDATQSFTLTVGEIPAITSAASASFTAGSPGSFTVTTTGTPTPAITESGTLPAGVTLTDNSDGTATLAGTPAARTAGTYPITITASNATGTATQSFTLTVSQAPAITSASAATFTAGTVGSFTVTTTGQPTPAITESGALPAGVTLTDNGDGTATLAGTPTAGTGGTYPIIITASNGTSPAATQSFTLTVDEAPAITSAASASFTAGSPGSFTVTTTGYPTTSVTESGALPKGVTFTGNADGTATIAGTPAVAGTYSLALTASNGTGPSATQTFTLTVLAAGSPAITSAATATATAGTAFTFTVTTSGTPVPSLTKTGALPAGVTFSNNGNGTATISGTPTAGGIFTLTITAKNKAGTGTQTFTLTVSQAPAITSAATATATAGTPFTFTVKTKGYPAPVITESGTLPAGLSLSSNGNGTATIAGTPIAGGVFTLTITAKNSAGTSAAQAFTLTVDQAPAITSATTATATTGTAFTFTVTTSGTPVPSLSKTGALPTGVTFSGNGNGTATISGTPTTGGIFTLTITAKNKAGAVTQTFTLTVSQAPAITSAATATATVGTPFTFTVKTKGYPAPVITESGTLPAGLTLSGNGNGTSTIAGTPTTGGTFTVTITAGNSLGTARQTLTIRVRQAPAITRASRSPSAAARRSAT